MNPDIDPAVLAIALVVEIVLSLAVYAWVALALSRVFAKLGVEPWKAWVPIVNSIAVFQLGGLSALWVIALFLPVVQVAGLVVYFFAIHTINRRFGKGAGFTVLAVVLFPVWASILGFGRALPLGDSPAASFEARMTGLQVNQQPGSPTQPSAPAAVPPPLAPSNVPPPVAPAPPQAAIPFPSQSTAPPSNPWAPPISSVPGVTINSTVPPAPAPIAAPPPFIAPAVTPPPMSQPVTQHPAAPVLDDDFDETIVTRRAPSWKLAWAGSSPVVVTGDVAFVGRNPAASVTDSSPQLIPVADPSKTMSKTHARLQRVDGGWTITDLNSTNGVVLVSPGGVETEIEPGRPTIATETFKLGQCVFTLSSGR